MPCITQPDATEEIKQAKTAVMKNNLDKHVAERQQRMTSTDFLGMTEKEFLMNKPILTKMGILWFLPVYFNKDLMQLIATFSIS